MTKDLLKRIFVKETSLYSYSTWNMISIINQKKKKKKEKEKKTTKTRE